MRYEYVVMPSEGTGPDTYLPVLHVKLNLPHKVQQDFEPLIPAIVDTGATYCLFHADIGRGIGLEIEDGRFDSTCCANGTYMNVYFHIVTMVVGEVEITTEVGFSDDMALAGLLGRIGFFDNFRVIFDYSTKPPGFDVEPLSHILVPVKRN
jgi:hypothetical protein